MNSYGFTLKEINEIHLNKANLNAHMVLWNNIGSVADTLAYRNVEHNMPYSFKKHRIEPLVAYFEEAKVTADAILNDFVVTDDDFYRMRLYLKAEFYTLMFNHIHTAINHGIDGAPSLPRAIYCGIPNLPLDVSPEGVVIVSKLIPSEKIDNRESDAWMMSAEFFLNHRSSLVPLDEERECKTLRDLLRVIYGESVSNRCVGDLFDCNLSAAKESIVLSAIMSLTEKLQLQIDTSWKVPGRVAMLNFSIKPNYAESVYMNYMADNSYIIHPYAYR